MRNKSFKAVNKFKRVISFIPVILAVMHPIKGIRNWRDYLRDIFNNYKKVYQIYYLRNGLKIKTRARSIDKYIMVETNLYGVYTKNFSIKKDDIVLDIGAHIGSFALLASKVAKAGKVYAFEPEKSNFLMIKNNIKLNNASNILVFQKALSKRTGKETLYLSPDNFSAHSIYRKENKQKHQVIDAVSLSYIIRQNKIKIINFLKMDIEGAEYEILLNLNREIFKLIEKIALEYHQMNKKNKCKVLKSYLEKQGFKVTLKKLYYGETTILYATKS